MPLLRKACLNDNFIMLPVYVNCCKEKVKLGKCLSLLLLNVEWHRYDAESFINLHM